MNSNIISTNTNARQYASPPAIFNTLKSLINIYPQTSKHHLKGNHQTNLGKSSNYFLKLENETYYTSTTNIPFQILFINVCHQLNLININLLQNKNISKREQDLERIKFNNAFRKAEIAYVLYKKVIKDEFEKHNFLFENKVIVPIEKSDFFMREILFKHMVDIC